MAGDRKLQLLITADARQAQRALGNLERTAGKSGKGIESSIGGIQRGLVGMGTGALAVGAFKAFEDSERVGRQLEQVIKSTGGAARVTAGQVDELVQALSKKGGVDDEELTAGATQLLQYKNIANQVGKNNDIFNQATKAAADYSARTGKDAVAANTLLGKSLSAPIESIGILRKAGIRLNEEQIERIKTGDLLTGQQIILAEFEKRYGGALEAGATTSGKARVAVDNMGESVGKVLAPALGLAADSLGTLADGFSKLPAPVQTATVGITGLAVATAVAGPKILGLYRTMSSGFGTAKAFTSLIVEATKDRAVGVSRTSAALGALGDSVGGSNSKLSSLASTMGKYPATTGLAAGGVAVLGLALADMAHESAVAKKNAQDLLDLSGSLGGSLKDAFSDKLAKTIADVAGGFDIGDSGEQFGQNMKDAGVSAKELQRVLLGSDASFEAFRIKLQRSGTAGQIFAKDLIQLRGASEDARSKQDALTSANKALNVATDKTSGSTSKLNDKLSEQADAADAASSKILQWYGAQTSGLDRQIEVEAAIDAVTESFRKNGATTDLNTEAGRDNVTQLEAGARAAYAAAAASGNADQAMAAYRLRLLEGAVAAGMTKEQVDQLVGKLALTKGPWDAKVTANTDDANAKIDSLWERIGALAGVSLGLGGGSLTGISGGTVTRGSGGDGGQRSSSGPKGLSATPRPKGIRAGGMGDATTVVIQLDSAEIARHTITSQNRSTRSTGRSPVLTSISSVTR